MPTSALCTCISFSLVLCFFKTLNSNFTFECPTNAILQRVSKTVADQRGGSVPTLFFDQQYKSVYRCAYARSLFQKQDQCFGFPYQGSLLARSLTKSNLGTGWFMNLKNGIIKSLRQGAPAIFYGIKPGRLRAISPFGAVARSQTSACTRMETHVRGVGKAFAARSRVFSRLLGRTNNRACNIWTAVILDKGVVYSYMIPIVY